MEHSAIEDFLHDRGSHHGQNHQCDNIEGGVRGGYETSGDLIDILISEEPEDRYVEQWYQRDLQEEPDREPHRNVDRPHPPTEISTPVEPASTGPHRTTHETEPQRHVEKDCDPQRNTMVVEIGLGGYLPRRTTELRTDRCGDIEIPSSHRDHGYTDKCRRDDACRERADGEHHAPCGSRWRKRLGKH